jgi:hypothetical protein
MASCVDSSVPRRRPVGVCIPASTPIFAGQSNITAVCAACGAWLSWSDRLTTILTTHQGRNMELAFWLTRFAGKDEVIPRAVLLELLKRDETPTDCCSQTSSD